MPQPLDQLVESVLAATVTLRHEIHAHPELSREEVETSRRVREALAQIDGLDVRPALTGTDVVAVLEGRGKQGDGGRCLALRADLDALPMQEETGAPYASTCAGVMHACGHDGHTAILVSTARVLAELRDQFAGCVKFIFQPDEEDTGGAQRLCEAGVLDSPKVGAIAALHGWPNQPVGTIAVRSGAAMAANNPFKIRVVGQGSHGAYPHRGVDPVVTAAHIVTGLQTIVARTVDPLDSAVVSVGRIAAGSACNVIPESCELVGTLRYLRPATGEHLQRRLREVAEKTAAAHGARAEVEIVPGYPPVINAPEMAELVAQVGREVLGESRVVVDEPPSLGVEDFAYYAQRVPGVIFRLGVRPVDRDSYPGLHNPRYDFNDDALGVGIRLLSSMALRYLA